MTDEEYQQLLEMRDCIQKSCIMSFDSEYMEAYAQLLAKSLEGKGNGRITND